MDLVWISLCSATDLHVHALCLHVGDGAVGDKLAETKVERSESGTTLGQNSQGMISDEVLAAAKVERE